MVSQLSAAFTSRGSLLFITLNIADAALTTSALSSGGSELNPFYFALGNPIVVLAAKILLVGVIILGLVMSRRLHLLNWLNIGMGLIVAWNVMALLSWSL